MCLFDYKFLNNTLQYLIGDITCYLKRGQMPNPNFTIHSYFYLMKEVESFFMYPVEERKLQLEIAHDIRREGVMNYLRIDDGKRHELRDEYLKNEIKPVHLFVKLLREEHYNRQKQKKRLLGVIK